MRDNFCVVASRPPVLFSNLPVRAHLCVWCEDTPSPRNKSTNQTLVRGRGAGGESVSSPMRYAVCKHILAPYICIYGVVRNVRAGYRCGHGCWSFHFLRSFLLFSSNRIIMLALNGKAYDCSAIFLTLFPIEWEEGTKGSGRGVVREGGGDVSRFRRVRF